MFKPLWSAVSLSDETFENAQAALTKYLSARAEQQGGPLTTQPRMGRDGSRRAPPFLKFEARFVATELKESPLNNKCRCRLHEKCQSLIKSTTTDVAVSIKKRHRAPPITHMRHTCTVLSAKSQCQRSTSLHKGITLT